MRAGADADIVLVAPIGQIVAGLVARTGVVRNLVGRQAGRFEQACVSLEEVAGQLLVRNGGSPPAAGVEGVPGSIVSWYSDRCSPASSSARRSSASQAGERLAGARIDQVEGEAGEMSGRQPIAASASSRCAARPRNQRCIVERLHAERQPVDPGGGEAGEALGLGRVRVGLQRDLEIGRGGPAPAMRSISAATVAGGISDGVPPPKKTTSRSPRRQRRLPVQLGEQRVAPAASSMPSRTWLLKSQYGHFGRQNGQWI